MIDTIKLNIYKIGNIDFYNLCVYNSSNRINGFIINNQTGTATKSELYSFKTIEYDEYTLEVLKGKYVASWNYHIHYRIFEDRIELEFSLPKFIYGTNVLELKDYHFKSSPYELLRNGVKFFFKKITPNVNINYSYVVLKRWDFCYNQVFVDKYETDICLKYLKLANDSKHDIKNYNYGIVEISKSKYFKIYHKGKEFEKNDSKKLHEHLCHDRFLELANRTLRYEKKFTPKSWSYHYNIHVKYQHQVQQKKDYYKAKKLGKVTKQQRKDFESLINFTLGNSKVYGATKLMDWYFNHLYELFRKEIKSKYNLGKKSTTTLKKLVVEEHENKRQFVKILSYIKVFGSLKKAQENKAFSKKTYYRYKKLMSENNLSDTKVNININQDWLHENYNRYVYNNINMNAVTNLITFGV